MFGMPAVLVFTKSSIPFQVFGKLATTPPPKITAAIGVQIPVVAVKFQKVYDYAIVQHPWQVSETISHGFAQAM